MIKTGTQTKKIMLEHLKYLKEAAEECDEKMLGVITTAMVETAQFLTSCGVEADEPAEK